MNKLAVESLGFMYPGGAKVLSDVNFTLDEGDFLLLCGVSGSGKSTLLRAVKPSLTPRGELFGRILLDGVDVRTLTPREMAGRIGFVAQSPDDQIVTDRVWHELAFGLESLGAAPDEIRKRTAEMASFFGIRDWFHRDVSELSGGQKQILTLASVMTLRPELLILDEPASQLDPIAAADLISALGRINRELGTTIIVTDHRPEDAFAFANKLAILDSGRLSAFGSPSEVGKILFENKSDSFGVMPAAARIWAGVGLFECPVTVKDGRKWLSEVASARGLLPVPEKKTDSVGRETVLSADEISYRYERKLPDVVKGLSLELGRGEFLAVLGPNGSGKSTTLKLLAGIFEPWEGKISRGGRVGFLPQDPKLLLLRDSVREELCADRAGNFPEIVRLCGLDGLLDRHPYDLSGGERQRVALAKVLLSDPDVLLLDEPTRGLDASFRRVLASILGELKSRGKSILAVSHDTEFCADYADRCALFFDGRIVSEGSPRGFFSGMSYYTTPARRIAGELCGAVTVGEVILACGGEVPEVPESPRGGDAKAAVDLRKKLPAWRRIVGACGVISAAVSFILALRTIDFTDVGSLGKGNFALTTAFILSLIVAVCGFGLGEKRSPRVKRESGKLSWRSMIAAAVLLALAPITVIFGTGLKFSRSYYVISLTVAAECLLPFFVIFEGKKPSAREISLIASLCALGVAGRAAFFMFPQFKPVLALTVIVGAALGCERGFLVGAMTMLISNVLFSQGPWTPWQMLAMGLCGFFAGIIFRRGYSRVGLMIYGGLSAVILYGGIMNFASAVIWQSEPSIGTILAYYATGIPMDLVHAAATVLFLFIAGDSMMRKLERVLR